MNRLVIRNGILVTPDELCRCDILIEGAAITRVTPHIEEVDAASVDAAGLYVLPGVIDAHVHLRDPGATHKEDFGTGTRAALAGGVTTVLDMPNNPQPTTTLAALQQKRVLARAQAVCDYGFFVGATADNWNWETSPGAQVLGEWGAVGVKVYLGATTGALLLTDFDSIYRHFNANHRAPVVVHAEDDQVLQYFRHAAGRHSARRPPLAASLAVARALAIAAATGHQLHIAHLSTARELELVTDARAHGIDVTCEVTPQHLFLSTEDEERLGGLGIVNPPLRSPEDVRALWSGLHAWDLVATDHAPHTLAEKHSAAPPSGMPGLETLLPLLLNAAGQKRLSLQDIARLTARNPARVFHLARKGEIAPGYDADLVLLRPEEEYLLQKPWQTKSNWSPFEGWRVRGKIVQVLLRGQTVLHNGEILAAPGYGAEVSLDHAA